MTPLDMRQLRQVAEVVRAGSIAKAAHALGVSQPTLSKSLQRMEDLLGVALFERSDGGATPTAFGVHLARRAVEVLGGVASIAGEVRLMANGEMGRIRIGASPALGAGLMPGLVAAVLARFPRLTLDIAQAHTLVLTERLVRRELDIVFVHARPCPPQVRETRFPDSRIVLAVRPGHALLAAGRRLSLAEVFACRVAATSLVPEFDAAVMAGLNAAAHANYHAYRAPDYATVAAICRASDAVGVAPAFALAPLLRRGELFALDTELDWPVAYAMRMMPEGEATPVLGAIAALAMDVYGDGGGRGAVAAQ